MKHLEGLNFISQVFCHSSSLSRSFWRREVSLSDLTGRYSRQSSAKRRTFEVRLLGRSFMYSRKKRGPSTVPCGTPEVT